MVSSPCSSARREASFSDKMQLVPLIKAAVDNAWRGISSMGQPVRRFNNHAGSTKS
jgi:hypothetical protein